MIGTCNIRSVNLKEGKRINRGDKESKVTDVGKYGNKKERKERIRF